MPGPNGDARSAPSEPEAKQFDMRGESRESA